MVVKNGDKSHGRNIKTNLYTNASSLGHFFEGVCVNQEDLPADQTFSWTIHGRPAMNCLVD